MPGRRGSKCCCGPPTDVDCLACLGSSGPLQFQIEVSGLLLGCCALLNGTYVLDYEGTSGICCVWSVCIDDTGDACATYGANKIYWKLTVCQTVPGFLSIQVAGGWYTTCGGGPVIRVNTVTKGGIANDCFAISNETVAIQTTGTDCLFAGGSVITVSAI